MDRGFYTQIETGYSKTLRYRNNSAESYLISGADHSYAPIFGLGFGYSFGNQLRLGVNGYKSDYKFSATKVFDEDNIVDYRDSKVKVRSTAFMVNGYYDFSGFKNLIPYLTVGGGLAFNKSGDFIVDHYAPNTGTPDSRWITKGKNRTNLAWSVGAGFVVPVTDHLNINLSMNFLDYGKSVTSNQEIDLLDNSIHDTGSKGSKIRIMAASLGLIYKF
jgi:opacity protein-like surface antigen